MKIYLKVFHFFSSLKLAIMTIAGMAFLLAVATIIESKFDTPTAQYWVYQTFFFRSLLTIFGLNILCVALSRYPWKKRHIPFLIAHIGILTLLYGSFLTYKIGLDGSMRLQEGDATSAVEMNQPILAVNTDDNVITHSVPWIPPHVKFAPIDLKEHHFKIDQFYSHADGQIDFKEAAVGAPAIQIEIKGGPMKMKQSYWLWGGDLNWMNVQAGPARLELMLPASENSKKPEIPNATNERPRLYIIKWKNTFEMVSNSQQAGVRRAFIPGKGLDRFVFDPGWKGGIEIRVLKAFSSAEPNITYSKSKIEYGMQAPGPAIRVVPISKDGLQGSPVWLGLGDRAQIEVDQKVINIAYVNRRVILPFSVKLDHFKMEYYEGTRDPSQYASQVSLPGEQSEPIWIKMNEPLTHKGFTFYQASYEPGEPRPTVSVLSVNRDPGRVFKYWGSLLIVLGSVLLFFVKMRERSKRKLS